MIIEGSILPKDIMTLNMYAPKIATLKYMKQKGTEQ
jgi:hypothetical protein